MTQVVLTTHTPIRAAHYFVVAHCSGCIARYTKIREFDTTVFVRKDVGPLDIPMYHTLVVKIHEPFEYLSDVHPDQSLRELSEPLAYVVE